MIDIGVNLNHDFFLNDLLGLKMELHTAGIEKIIAISSSLAESQLLIDLSKAQPDLPLHYTLGCHPHNASEWGPHTYQAINTLLHASAAVAIGETGLDFNRNFSSPEAQMYAFQEQIALAQKHALPLFLHERDAESAVISTLKNHISGNVKGVIHCFTGGKQSLKAYLDLGLYIGVTGWVCDERRGQDLQDAVKYIPDDRLLIETDAPYLLPRTIKPRPKKNHPKYLPFIVETIATLRHQSVDQITTITRQNTADLFAI